MEHAETFKDVATFYASNRQKWRQWLKVNYKKHTLIWLIIYHKKSKTPSIYYDEAVEEALCFGWIDSVKYKRDAESAYQMFTPRKAKSNWSKLNKERVERMTKAGLMTNAGQKLIDYAKQNGNWDVLNEIEDKIIPADLLQLFDENKIAKSHFENFSSSSKKIILGWIQSAKRPETRAKRMLATIIAASENKKAFP